MYFLEHAFDLFLRETAVVGDGDAVGFPGGLKSPFCNSIGWWVPPAADSQNVLLVVVLGEFTRQNESNRRLDFAR